MIGIVLGHYFIVRREKSFKEQTAERISVHADYGSSFRKLYCYLVIVFAQYGFEQQRRFGWQYVIAGGNTVCIGEAGVDQFSSVRGNDGNIRIGNIKQHSGHNHMRGISRYRRKSTIERLKQ